MEIQFVCECDHQLSEFTRGPATELDTRLRCDHCGALYAVTITALGTDAPAEP